MSQAMDLEMTPQAKGAADGFKAERVLAQQANVKPSLSAYFGKTVLEIQVISGKKSDVVIVFADGSKTTAQIKNFTNPNMAKWPFHQTNRRWLKDLPAEFQGIASHVCLGQPKNRGRLKGLTRQEFLSPYVLPTAENSKSLARLVLLGSEVDWAPRHMILTLMTGGVIQRLWAEPMVSFLASIDSAMYPTPEMGEEGTSLFLCPEISMQRKGGDKGAASADQIQFKLYFDAATMSRHHYVELLLQ
jgi:hypothetical protein